MRLDTILDKVNSLEKNSFLKIIDTIISSKPKKHKEIEKFLSDVNTNLKGVDSIIISSVFNLIQNEFSECIKQEFLNTTSQLDILVDIIIKDGNNLMREDWFYKLYEEEIKSINRKTKELKAELESEKSSIDPSRKRDYLIYKACVNTAYFNDLENNRDNKITYDELSILLTLSKEIGLSQEEVKLINYIVIPPKKMELDELISELKNIGIVFYSKKNRQLYIADEIVRGLRKLRKKEIADKFYKRFLNQLREPQINIVCRKHNIDIKNPLKDKIKAIINQGISFTSLVSDDIYKDNPSLTEKKSFINDIWQKGFEMPTSLKGSTLDDKINSFITYFEDVEKDEKVGISVDGYEKLLTDISETLPEFNKLIREEFQIQEENALVSNLLLDYNLKPRDILDVLEKEDLVKFCEAMGLKKRGNIILNIMETYKDSENLYIENYEKIGFRDLNALKENGIVIKESELGLRFEDVTKSVFEKLGFNVDETLKKSLNTAKNKIDLVLNLENEGLIIIECKTVKENGYNKFSSVSRQIKSYIDLATKNEYKVVKSLLVAPDFSDDFVNECDLDFELNLSLITASSLSNILKAFKGSKHKQFPYQLLMKDVLIKEDRIIKAINK